MPFRVTVRVGTDRRFANDFNLEQVDSGPTTIQEQNYIAENETLLEQLKQTPGYSGDPKRDMDFCLRNLCRRAARLSGRVRRRTTACRSSLSSDGRNPRTVRTGDPTSTGSSFPFQHMSSRQVGHGNPDW